MLCPAGKQQKWLLQFNFNSSSMDSLMLSRGGGGGVLAVYMAGGGVLAVYMAGGSDIFLRLKIYTRGILWIKRPVTIFLVLKSV